MTPPPRKNFDPPLSLREFLDHAQAIVADPSEPSELRAEAMRALSVHISPSSPSRAAGPSPAFAAFAIVVSLAVGVLVGLVLA